MLDNIYCLGHSALKILYKNKVIYIDPFNLTGNNDKADIIFITHSHYDHFSISDINKIKKEKTKIVIPFDIYEKVLDIGFKKEDITLVEPDNFYEIDEIKFSTVRAYNINKNFHLKESNWVGYILKLNNFKYYIAGDTDITEENKKINCDVAFIPIGGTYTMDYLEAAQLTNIIKPKVVVPIHYGSIVGNSLDCEKFKHLVNKDIECRVMF